MIVASIVLRNTLFLKASVKRVGFVLEHLVSMENIEESFFFAFLRAPKEFVYSSFYLRTLHLLMVKNQLIAP